MNWALRDPAKGPPQQGGHPGGWFYHDETTGWKAESSSFHGLVHKIIQYWQSNAMPIQDAFKVVTDYICAKVGQPYCYDLDNPDPAIGKPRKSSAFGFLDFWNGTLNLGKWALKGRKFVDRDVAEERAKQCASCPMNMPIESCIPCRFKQAAMEVTKGVVHGLTTSVDSELKICDVCKCSTKVLVHVYDTSSMNDNINEEQMSKFKQVNCWKVK